MIRIRAALVFTGLLMLAACGGANDRAPFTDSRIPPSLGPRFWAPEGWAWGLIGVGEAPVQRYGVSSTIAAPRGNILILTDDRELAEAWFETVRDLNTRGYSVWVLERVGQGGSARYSGPRDLIHAPTFDDDVAATKALARSIVSTDSETPLTMVGEGLGGLIALKAIEDGAPAAALVLSSPRLKPEGPLPAWPQWLMKLGVGRLPSGIGQTWSREGPDDFKAGRTKDRQRGAVQLAWQMANPDLRMGGHSLGWASAFSASSAATLKALTGVKIPTLALSPDRAAREACGALADCKVGPTSGGAAFLGRDADRAAWIASVSCATPVHPTIARPGSETCPG